MKFKIFISSTSDDLAAYRDVAIHVAQRIGLEVTASEGFGPDGRPPVDYCKQAVESADMFLGLYAYRYGFQPDNHGGKSITHLEYEWALNSNKEICAYLVDDNQPWMPKFFDEGDKKVRLIEFKNSLMQKHVVDKFTTPEQLRSQLFEHLPELRNRLSQQQEANLVESAGNRKLRGQERERALPPPPQPYYAHTYILLQTAQVIGRKSEMSLLDAWVSDPAGPNYSARILSFVAIGGMGKSALAWKWFHDNAPNVIAPLAGRMWWSFYENNAGFDRFVTFALAYCTNRSPKAIINEMTLPEREAELLRTLDETPFLLTLDGAERLLIAYSGADFAHLADDELDERTANYVAETLGLTKPEADLMTAQRRLRTCIDPHVGNFLKRLAKVRASRILITTRLYPSELQTVTGQALPGCAAVVLKGMDPEDAISLWQAMGVSGTGEQLKRLFSAFDYYPLLIRALAGEVARFRRSPGNFDTWRQAYPNFNPYSLPLVQVKTHVLEHSLMNLGNNEKDLLHTIAAFRAPAAYDTLLGLFQRKYQRRSVEDFDNLLGDLEDRGLIGWNRLENNYDLHPIVRGVVWTGLGAAAKRGVFNSLQSYFEAIPAKTEHYDSLESAQPHVELFNALVGLQKYGEASAFYFARIHQRVNFERLGISHLKLAMLNSVFPNGYDNPPEGLDNAIYAQLAQCYSDESKFYECFDCWLKKVHGDDDDHNPEMDYCYLSDWCLGLGLLGFSEKFIAGADHFAKDDPRGLNSELFDFIAEHHITIGDFPTAMTYYKRKTAAIRKGYLYNPKYDLNAEWSRMHFSLGDFAFAARHGDVLIRSEAKLRLGRDLGVTNELEDLLVRSREHLWHDIELKTRRVLAEVHLRKGDPTAARDVLADFWNLAERGPYRLLLADAYNVLAEIEREDGNRSASIEAAEEAYRRAWCDGPPRTYQRALQKAKRLLDEARAPHPIPPERDRKFDGVLDQIFSLLEKRRTRYFRRN